MKEDNLVESKSRYTPDQLQAIAYSPPEVTHNQYPQLTQVEKYDWSDLTPLEKYEIIKANVLYKKVTPSDIASYLMGEQFLKFQKELIEWRDFVVKNGVEVDVFDSSLRTQNAAGLFFGGMLGASLIGLGVSIFGGSAEGIAGSTSGLVVSSVATSVVVKDKISSEFQSRKREIQEIREDYLNAESNIVRQALMQKFVEGH